TLDITILVLQTTQNRLLAGNRHRPQRAETPQRCQPRGGVVVRQCFLDRRQGRLRRRAAAAEGGEGGDPYVAVGVGGCLAQGGHGGGVAQRGHVPQGTGCAPADVGVLVREQPA